MFGGWASSQVIRQVGLQRPLGLSFQNLRASGNREDGLGKGRPTLSRVDIGRKRMNSRMRTGTNFLAARACAVFFLLSVPLGPVGGAAAQDETTARIEHADKEPQNWLTFYGNYRGWSYSPLNQITRENVKNIVPVWAFPAGFPTGTAGLRPGLEAAPLVVDGVLYLEGMQNNVYAVEAATGRSIWTYEYKWPEVKTFSIRGARGIAYGDGRIYMGTQDNHVVALDAEK